MYELSNYVVAGLAAAVYFSAFVGNAKRRDERAEFDKLLDTYSDDMSKKEVLSLYQNLSTSPTTSLRRDQLSRLKELLQTIEDKLDQ